MKTVRSRQNALVRRFRGAARAREAGRRELLLDGVRLIRDARDARVPLVMAFVSRSALDRGDDALSGLARDLESDGVEVVAGSDGVMDAVSPVRESSGAVAVGDHEPATLDEILMGVGNGGGNGVGIGMVLAPIGVQDPGNLGAIIRTAAAAGAAGVAVTEGSADPFGWKALRGAMGSTFRLPVARTGNAAAAIRCAREAGFTVLAAVPRTGRMFYDADLGGRRFMLVGTEGGGLHSELASLADDTVSVPMAPSVDSLNVAVAAAVLLYEARRQLTHR